MKLIIDEFSTEKRIDVYLTDYLKEYSRSKLQSEIKNGAVLVNSLKVKPSYELKEGDIIDFTPSTSLQLQILPENIDIDVVWEDENMLVVNKPSNMLTHPTVNETSGTLVNALLYKYGDNLSDINGDFRRGIIHRLDRNTSGLLMIAKNNDAHEYLVDMMKNHKIEKKYLAVVRGVVEEDEFEINSPIKRNPTQPHKMCVGKLGEGKDSLSRVRVLERFKDATLVEIGLITGRTHQIRVHLSSIGHPVYNDTLYGFGKMKIKTQEQVLQSYKLIFLKPFDGEIIDVEIEPDEELKRVLAFLKN